MADEESDCPIVTVRLVPSGRKWLRDEALRLGVSRSDVIRQALKAWAALPQEQRKVTR